MPLTRIRRSFTMKDGTMSSEIILDDEDDCSSLTSRKSWGSTGRRKSLYQRFSALEKTVVGPVFTALTQKRSQYSARHKTEINVLCSDLVVSTEFTLDRLQFVLDSPNIVRVELEDLIERRDQTLFLNARELLIKDRRPWQSVAFLDHLYSEERLERYLLLKHNLWRLIEQDVLRRKIPVQFQAILDIKRGTTVSSVIASLQMLLDAQHLYSIEFDGAIFGLVPWDTPKELLGLCRNDHLRETISLKVLFQRSVKEKEVKVDAKPKNGEGQELEGESASIGKKRSVRVLSACIVRLQGLSDNSVNNNNSNMRVGNKDEAKTTTGTTKFGKGATTMGRRNSMSALPENPTPDDTTAPDNHVLRSTGIERSASMGDIRVVRDARSKANQRWNAARPVINRMSSRKKMIAVRKGMQRTQQALWESEGGATLTRVARSRSFGHPKERRRSVGSLRSSTGNTEDSLARKAPAPFGRCNSLDSNLKSRTLAIVAAAQRQQVGRSNSFGRSGGGLASGSSRSPPGRTHSCGSPKQNRSSIRRCRSTDVSSFSSLLHSNLGTSSRRWKLDDQINNIPPRRGGRRQSSIIDNNDCTSSRRRPSRSKSMDESFEGITRRRPSRSMSMDEPFWHRPPRVQARRRRSIDLDDPHCSCSRSMDNSPFPRRRRRTPRRSLSTDDTSRSMESTPSHFPRRRRRNSLSIDDNTISQIKTELNIFHILPSLRPPAAAQQQDTEENPAPVDLELIENEERSSDKHSIKQSSTTTRGVSSEGGHFAPGGSLTSKTDSAWDLSNDDSESDSHSSLPAYDWAAEQTKERRSTATTISTEGRIFQDDAEQSKRDSSRDLLVESSESDCGSSVATYDWAAASNNSLNLEDLAVNDLNEPTATVEVRQKNTVAGDDGEACPIADEANAKRRQKGKNKKRPSSGGPNLELLAHSTGSRRQKQKEKTILPRSKSEHKPMRGSLAPHRFSTLSMSALEIEEFYSSLPEDLSDTDDDEDEFALLQAHERPSFNWETSQQNFNWERYAMSSDN